jgi:nicotinamidase/pyrazinamidase
MQAAILVIDLVKDTFRHDHAISRAARAFMPALNDFLEKSRILSHHIIYSTDSFLENDFIFRGRMKPHSLRGTEGADVATEIKQGPNDVWLPKRRLSAFFKTDLDQTLRTWGVDTVAVAGVATPFCVLMTALDAFSHDFNTVILEDLSAAADADMHRACLDLYRDSVVHPLLRIMTAEEFLSL